MADRSNWWTTGATGILSEGRGPLDRAAFLRWAYAWARASGGSVVQPDQPPGRTFDRYRFDRGSGTTWVLRHRIVPVIAAVRTEPTFAPNAPGFIDPPDEVDPLVYGYQPLTAQEMNRSLTTEDVDALPPAERREIKRWKPTAVGDVLFNCWD